PATQTRRGRNNGWLLCQPRTGSPLTHLPHLRGYDHGHGGDRHLPPPGRNPGDRLFSAAGALLVVGIASAAGRWWAGRFGDRHDPRLLLAPGLLTAALGMIALPLGSAFLAGGAVLFGIGFGLLQNATLVLMMGRVSESEYGLGSTLWNVAFDGGTGLGAFLFGFVIAAVGFSWAFYLCAGSVASALVLVRLDHHTSAACRSTKDGR
ncbi:MAG: MFS transporter, partial [Actinobacteria bacterium]|nr:MFS transporter [Actinomycetota bacterium]